MTSTAETTAIAIEAPPRQPQPSTWAELHEGAVTAWKIASFTFPILEKVVASPWLEELLTEALRALDEGVAPGPFTAATDALRGARARHAAMLRDRPGGSGPQPVQDASTDGVA